MDSAGAAIDLSGDTLTFTARKKKDGDVIFTLSTASEITISECGLGICLVPL